MFFSIQKLLSQSPKTPKNPQKNPKNEEEDSNPCSNCFGHGDQTQNPNPRISSARSSRSNFAKSASSSLFSNTNFTNHESLPSLSDSFSSFSESFPQFRETLKADFIRKTQYIHLENHVCLDYSGVNLFSHAQMNQSNPIFTISYKSASIRSEIQYGEKEKGFEFEIKNRIARFLKVSGEDYGLICTANRTSAFRLLAETYPFESKKKLVAVYDYESEAIRAMSDCAAKRGAKIISASFVWPGMRIHTAKLKRILSNGKNRGLFVFPLMSRVSGVRYPYLWVKLAKDNGWHVILDACTLGPKDMNALGIALIQPDFVICSFFKLFGENPAGFATVFVKKSSGEILQNSVLARSVGMVSIVRAGNLNDFDAASSFSGPILNEENCETEKTEQEEEEGKVLSEIVEEIEREEEIEFHGLDHADSLGLLLIHNRLRCLINWLVIALMKLHHPSSEKGNSLVKIYGPRVKFDRGPALAFNVFDWKGEKIDPLLVQKLADRSNISLSCGFLEKIAFLEKYEGVKEGVLEERVCGKMADLGCGKKEIQVGIAVVNASFGYLANFEDAYRLWAFVAKFLDADFVEKERWRYVALNQKMIEL